MQAGTGSSEMVMSSEDSEGPPPQTGFPWRRNFILKRPFTRYGLFCELVRVNLRNVSSWDVVSRRSEARPCDSGGGRGTADQQAVACCVSPLARRRRRGPTKVSQCSRLVHGGQTAEEGPRTFNTFITNVTTQQTEASTFKERVTAPLSASPVLPHTADRLILQRILPSNQSINTSIQQ